MPIWFSLANLCPYFFLHNQEMDMPGIELGENICHKARTLYTQDIDIMERFAFLLDAVNTGKGEVVVGQVIYDLHDYAQDLCNIDEDIFSNYIFPDYGHQKQANCCFKETMEDYYKKILMKKEIEPTKIVEFLKNWIADQFSNCGYFEPSPSSYSSSSSIAISCSHVS
jgi:hypothetical protein